MLNNKQLEIITTSIEAALQPELWNKTIDLLVDAYQGLSGNIVVLDQNHDARIAIAMSKFIREDGYEMYEKFLNGEDADDTSTILKIYGIQPNIITSEYELLGKGTYDELPFSSFRIWQKNQFDIVQRYSIKINQHGPWLDVLFLHTDSKKGELLTNEIIEINQISQVFTSSIKLFRIMEQLRNQFNAALNALDKLGIACFLTINDAQVIHKNKASLELLDDDGININSSGRLSANNEHLDREIYSACFEAFKTSNGKSNSSEIMLSITRPSGKVPYLIIINPIIDSNAELELGLRCALVFVVDPSIPKQISVSGIVSLGKLTPAEAVICELLVEGKTTAQIMERRNVSENTIRQQIKTILSKLNCSSRIELLRLAIDTRLPIKNDATNL